MYKRQAQQLGYNFNFTLPIASTCAPVNVAPGNTVKTSLTALCPTLNAGSNFGVLISAFAGGSGTYVLYSRVQTPEGNGFSIVRNRVPVESC